MSAGRGILRVHALRAGTWPASPSDVTLTEADVASVAASYDPSRHHAPVVLGHPKTDDPAWGWVEGAEARGDGLWLDASLTPELSELVRARRYRTVSVSLWRPGAPGNPSPGSWSLRHLGFLGATPPACKGLAPIALSAGDADGSVTVDFAANDNHKKDSSMNEDEKKALEQRAVDLAERAKSLEAREAALSARERALALAAIGQEVDALIGAGKVLPAEKPGLVALMELTDHADTVDLSESEKGAAPGAVLRGFLKGLPARVDLGERSAPDGGTAPGAPKAPEGFTFSERGAALHTRALAIQAARKCDYLEAARLAEAEG